MNKSLPLKEVLPPDMHYALSDKVLSLTGEDLEEVARDRSKLSDEDHEALIKLAVHRIKLGKNVFPYDDLDFGEYSKGDPQW